MAVESLGNMSVETLATLVGIFFAFLIILHLKTVRTLRLDAEKHAQAEFKAHVQALMSKLDKMGVPGIGKAARAQAGRHRRTTKRVPAIRTRRLTFPTRSSWRRN
jgi:hypothetical protein